MKFAVWFLLLLFLAAVIYLFLFVFVEEANSEAANPDRPSIRINEFRNDLWLAGSAADLIAGIIRVAADTNSRTPEFTTSGEIGEGTVTTTSRNKIAQLPFTAWLADSATSRKYLLVAIGLAIWQRDNSLPEPGDGELLIAAWKNGCVQMADRIVASLRLLRVRVVALKPDVVIDRGQADGIQLNMEYKARRGNGLSDWKLRVVEFNPENDHQSVLIPVGGGTTDAAVGETLLLWRDRPATDSASTTA